MRSRTRATSQIGLFLICFYLCFLGGVMLQCLWSWDFSKFLLPIGRNLPEQFLIVIYALPFWKPYSCVWEMLFLRCGKTTLNVTYWCLSQGIKHASFTTTTPTTMDKSNLIKILAQIGGNLNFSKTPRISSWAKMKIQAGFTLVGSVLKPNRWPGEAKEDVWDILEAALLSPWGSGLCPTFLYDIVEQQWRTEQCCGQSRSRIMLYEKRPTVSSLLEWRLIRLKLKTACICHDVCVQKGFATWIHTL